LGKGGKSSSATTTTTKTVNETNNVDARTASAEGGLAVGANSTGNTINVLDGGAIETSADLIGQGLKVINQVTNDSLDFAEDSQKRAYDYVKIRTQSEELTLATMIIKYAIPAIVIVGALYFWSKKK
jgi:3-oxoacyl-ACP reductase-like protein